MGLIFTTISFSMSSKSYFIVICNIFLLILLGDGMLGSLFTQES